MLGIDPLGTSPLGAVLETGQGAIVLLDSGAVAAAGSNLAVLTPTLVVLDTKGVSVAGFEISTLPLSVTLLTGVVAGAGSDLSFTGISQIVTLDTKGVTVAAPNSLGIIAPAPPILVPMWGLGLRPPAQFSISPIEAVGDDLNPFTGAREPLERWHQWHAYAQWNNTRHRDYWPLAAFFAQSAGGQSVFQIPIFGYRRAIGTRAGSVSLASDHPADARTLTLAGGTGVLKAGDWFYLRHFSGNVPYAYVCVADESLGQVEISPGLRTAMVAGSSLNLGGGSSYVLDTMELVLEQSFGAAVPAPSPGHFQSFALEFVTAIRRLS